MASTEGIPTRPTQHGMNTLYALANNLFDIPNQLICPDFFVQQETETFIFPTPEVTLQAGNNRAIISIPTLDIGSGVSATSIASGQFTRSLDDMRTFIHDFTFAIFSDNTDQQLKTVFPALGDHEDLLTPDVVTKIDDKVYVFEFATRRMMGSVREAFKIKQMSYEGPLKTRIMRSREELHCFFGIIICSTDRICTNVGLPANLVNELIARFRCSLSIMQRLHEQGWTAEEDESSQRKQNIRAGLESLQFHKIRDNGRYFSKDILDPDDTPEIVSKVAGRYYESCCLNALLSLDKELFPSEFTGDDPIREFLNKASILNHRQDPKSVVKFPLFNVGFKDDLPMPGGGEDAYEKLWDEVIYQYEVNPKAFETSIEELKLIALSDYDQKREEELKTTRKSFHRVKVSIDTDTWVELHKVGVEGKSSVRNPLVEMYREEKSAGISYETDTTDITNFILGFDATASIKNATTHHDVGFLVKSALDQYGCPPIHGIQALKWIFSNTLYNWSDMMTDIGIELAISMKQHCKSREFVLKKLKKYPVWLLIKPTNSESHIFVSLLVNNDCIDLEEDGNCFKTWKKFKNYWCTEFVSYDESKITNLTKTGPFFITQVAQWARYFELNYESKELSSHAWAMIKLVLLVHLDDKHLTEETMTLFRYISMEKFSTLEKISSYKMLDKMPELCRSRLQSWVACKLFTEMRMGPYNFVMTKAAREKDQPRTKSMVWKGLRNPYLEIEISNPQALIELYYIGYAKNKDEKSNPNQDFALVNKIIKYEDKLATTDPDFFGSKDPLPDWKGSESNNRAPQHGNHFKSKAGPSLINLDFHEWSRSCVLHAADTLKAHIRKLYGDDWESIIEKDILDRLQSITWEEMATLKASSLFQPGVDLEKVNGKVNTRREKVVIRIIEELDNLAEIPMMSLVKSLEKLEEIGGLLVDIFKKNQHGGLREIYVLDLHSRIIQRAVEEIAKVYCSYLPSEVMVHPENKIRRPQQHMMTVAKDGSTHKANVSSSNDASVWNQGHHVLKFTQFMCRIIPDWLKPFYQRSMQLWMNRYIKLPDGIINLLSHRPDVRMYDPINQRLVDAHRGMNETAWMKNSNDYLTIESGMMQGILHYTSSLFHASMLMSRDWMFHHMAKKKSFRAYTCDMVSSDDSSRITDVVSNDDKMITTAKLYAVIDQVAILEFSKLFGIRMSPKSTICSTYVMEFNSEWLFRINLIRPVVKWSFACLGMTEDESIYERQEVWNTQITELLEGGSGFRQAHLTQIGQSILHYKMLGSSVNPLFTEHSNQLRNIPDPSLGFFLLDHPLAAGLFGLSFAHYIALTSNREVNMRAAHFLRNGEMTTTTKGIVTRGCVIRFGERKRAQKLIEKAERVLPNWREVIEEDPRILYTKARDKRSTAMKILTKLTSPSVMTTLSKNAALVRIISSSVYILNRHAMTLGSAWLKALEGDETYRELRKTCLYREICRDIPDIEPLDRKELSVLFPSHDSYQILFDKLLSCSAGVLTKGGSRKSLRSHIPIIKTGDTIPFTLERIIKHFWFGENLPTSARIANQCWEMYTQRIPWLRKSAKETLEESRAFESQIQLRNFIARQGSRSRTVHLTGSPVRDSTHQDMIIAAICRNQAPGYIITMDPQLNNERVESVAESISHNLYALHSFPCSDDHKKLYGYRILQEHRKIWTENLRLMNNRQARLALLQYYTGINRSSPEEVIKFFKMINDSKQGVLGGFTKRQKKDVNDRWVGKGEWFGRIGDVLVVIEMEDEEIKTIVCESIEKLKGVQALLSKFLFDANLHVRPKKNFVDSIYFDGRSIAPGAQGCPVRENPNLVEVPVSKVSINFDYYNGAFRIYTRQLGPTGKEEGPRITILSHAPKSWEFQPDKDLSSLARKELYSHWASNRAMDYRTAKTTLLKGITGLKYPMEAPKVDDFVRVSLLSTLVANGWNFTVGGELAAQLDMVTESEEIKWSEMEYGDDMFDDALFDEFAMVESGSNEDGDDSGAGSSSNPSPQDDLDMKAALDWQDVAQDLIDLEQTAYTQTDIRRGHKLWTNLVRTWNSNLSSKARFVLSNKMYYEQHEDIAKIFKHYFNWDMKLIQKDVDYDLDTVPEDDEIFESDDDKDLVTNLVIMNDEWWGPE